MVLVIRCLTDAAAQTLSTWGGEAVRALEEDGLRVCDLADESGLRDAVIDRLASDPPCFVAFFGHGHATGLCELPKGEGVVLGTADCSRLAGMVVYAAACLACRGFGEKVCGAGARGFLGFRDRFFVPITAWSPAGKLFGEAFIGPVLGFAKEGLELGDLFGRSQSLFAEKADQLARSDFAAGILLDDCGQLLALAAGSDTKARLDR